ncbi:MAG: transcriptional regulator, partial [Lachnospiraceae bacterium]|nr:transcriptional regulator [Lachnospiraceae bacterium]
MFGYEILQSYNDLEMLVYNYIMEHKNEVRYMTIRELAQAAHVSTLTIVRFCKKTGCDGYSEFKLRFKLFLQEEKEKQKKQVKDTRSDEIMYFLHTVTSIQYEEKINEVTQVIREA